MLMNNESSNYLFRQIIYLKLRDWDSVRLGGWITLYSGGTGVLKWRDGNFQELQWYGNRSGFGTETNSIFGVIEIKKHILLFYHSKALTKKDSVPF